MPVCLPKRDSIPTRRSQNGERRKAEADFLKWIKKLVGLFPYPERGLPVPAPSRLKA
jgi:hypothetical protein